jgi:uncharacterized protein (TIGR02145 family)
MKKALLIIFIIFYFSQLYSAEPLVKFYLDDGTSKRYNLSEIDNMKFTSAPATLQLHIFRNIDKNLYYPVQLIDSITFSFDQYDKEYINLWHGGFYWYVAICEIDSILLYYTTYTAVTIGEQHWMYKNLNVDHYQNGDSILELGKSGGWNNLKTGVWCYYNDDPVNGLIFGKLFNWYSVIDPRGLAPKGWHVPSDSEWTLLTTYLGGEVEASGKLKETGLFNWSSPNIGATNETGFSAIPGGYRLGYGNCEYIGYFCYFWTSSKSWGDYSWFRPLYFHDIRTYKDYIQRSWGLSVRCIKDE